MVTESFSWYSPRNASSNSYISQLESTRTSVKRLNWRNKTEKLNDVVQTFAGKDGLEAIDYEIENAVNMKNSNSYVKRDTFAQNKLDKYIFNLEAKRSEIVRELETKSQLEAVASTPDTLYPHLREPVSSRSEFYIEATSLPLATAMGYQPRNEFSTVPNQDERITSAQDLIAMTLPRSTKKGRTTVALKETLGEIGRIATYVTKAATVALATLLPMKTAYAPTELSNQKPTYSANLVNQREAYSNVEVPNLRLTENIPAVNSAPAMVEKVESVTSTPTVAPVIKTDTAIVKSHAKPTLSLEQRASPLHIDKVLALMNQRMAIVPSDYITREITKQAYVADTINVAHETAPLPTITPKPSIPDSFWEVRTPTGQIVYFNAGNTKPITPNSTNVNIRTADNSSKSEFIDSEWFAQAQVKAERMKKVRQPITKEYLAERIKPIEERASARSN